MRIREIEAENFKLFTKNFHEVNEIEKSDLIVFNGPNGYGKTSAFDIIEFCLTGTIKRIGKYNEELAVKKTEAFDNKILISDETKEAFVKILFDNDGKCIEIKYTYFPAKNKKRGASKENNPHNIFGCFNREIICDGEKIYNQEKFLSEIQFDDIEEIFDKCCFLSQDEHLQFLKAAKKSKAEGLNFLLDVPTEWEKEQEKVNKKIDLLSNKKSKNTSYIPRLKSRQEKEKQKLTELKEKMLESQEDTSITYRRLYTNKNVSWDNENFRIDEITYKNSIKEIDDLIYFSEHKQECGDYHWNLPYQDYIKEYNGDKNISFEEYPLEYAYRFINLLKREKDIEEKYEKEKRYRTIIDCIQKRQFDNLNWDFLQKEELLEAEVIDVIKIQLGEVDSLKRTQGIVQEAISTLKESRETLVSKADVIMKEELISSKNCPLCGASYSDREQLNEKIKEETNVLNKISDAMSREQTLKLYLSDLKKDYDYILIDCMPSLGMLTINALAAADSVIVPVQAHYLPLKGMTQLMKTIGKVQRQLNPNLKIDGVLLTLADMRTKLARTTEDSLRENYGKHIRIFKTVIPVAITAAESSAAGQSIYEYDKNGTVAKAYAEFTREVIQCGEKQRNKHESSLSR